MNTDILALLIIGGTLVLVLVIAWIGWKLLCDKDEKWMGK